MMHRLDTMTALFESIILVFMFLAGANFTLIWFAWENNGAKLLGRRRKVLRRHNFNSHSIHCSFTYFARRITR